MFPEIIVARTVHVSTWGLCVSLAALSVLWLGRRDAAARGIPPAEIERLWPLLLFGGFLGAHLYYLLAVAGWPFRHYPARVVLNVFSGTAVQGGLVGGALCAAVYARARGLSFLRFVDALAPAGALAQAITRVGCFAAGCCYGRPTSSFLGVVYSSPYADAATPRGVPLHPAQLYEAALDLCLAVVLRRRPAAERRPGALFALYLMGASLIRFGVEFFRGDDAGRLVAGLAHSQFTALALAAGAAALYFFRSQREVDYEVR